MTTILRRSGAIPRLSISSLSPCIRSRYPPHTLFWRASCVTTPRVRKYATVNPGDPKDPKEKEKDATTEGKSVAGDAKSPGKSARGFEQLYGDDGVMSSTSSSGKEASKKATLPEVNLSKDEKESIDSLVAMCKRGMPTEQANMIARAFEDIKREGIPPELREIIDARKSGKSLDIATMARLVRIGTKMARQSAEREVNRQMGKKKTNPVHLAHPRQTISSSAPKVLKDLKGPRARKGSTFRISS